MMCLLSLSVTLEAGDDDGGDRADGGVTNGSVDGAHRCVGGGLPEATELMGVSDVTMVETMWPLPLLLSMLVEVGWRR